MEEFAARLSFNLNRPVRDRTGLKGKYNIMLRYLFAKTLASTDDPQGGSVALDPIDAIQSQLGLRLYMAKEILEVLVVDHIEKMPTEN
jgi:uncharacterized protein (TIGR03435 family)